MSVFYERCACGAEFRVEADRHVAARNDLANWRTEHRHEKPDGDRYADQTGSHHTAGFRPERWGRLEDIE